MYKLAVGQPSHFVHPSSFHFDFDSANAFRTTQTPAHSHSIANTTTASLSSTSAPAQWMADQQNSAYTAPENAGPVTSIPRPRYFLMELGDPNEKHSEPEISDYCPDDDEANAMNDDELQTPAVKTDEKSVHVDVQPATDKTDDGMPTATPVLTPPTPAEPLDPPTMQRALLAPFVPPRGYVLFGRERAEPFNTPNLVADTQSTTCRYTRIYRHERPSGNSRPEIARLRPSRTPSAVKNDSSLELPRSFPARMTDGITAYPHITAAHAREQFYVDLRNLNVNSKNKSNIYADDDALRVAHRMISDYKTMNRRFHAKNPSLGYVTIITDASYLPGVIVLLNTIRESGSVFPLVALYTRNLSARAVDCLEEAAEDPKNMLEIYCIEALLPPRHHVVNVAHPRFADTWTKLRVFQLYNRFTTVAYLDVDMVMTMNDNIDYIFEYARWLPRNCIAAVHDCVCGQERYGPDKCIFTGQSSPTADYSHITAREGDSGPTTLFNSGLFLFHPTKSLWEAILYYFQNSTKLGEFRFPDQDFLITFFKYRWTGLPWQWMAVKTMAHRHSPVFRMDRANIIHYIVDKPWSKKVEKEDCGGEESPLHDYWHERFDQWCEQMREEKKWALLSSVGMYVGDCQGHRRIDDELPPVHQEAPPWTRCGEKYVLVDLEQLPPFRGYHRAAQAIQGRAGVVVSWAERAGVEEEDDDDDEETMLHVR